MTKANVNQATQTKVLLLAPLVLIPLCALLFYALGGGRGKTKASSGTPQKGLNTFLPAPQLKEGENDKLALYKKDDQDSQRLRRAEPFSLNIFDQAEATEGGLDEVMEGSLLIDSGAVEEPFSDRPLSRRRSRGLRTGGRSKDPADELEQKLTRLQQMLQDTIPAAPRRTYSRVPDDPVAGGDPPATPEMAQLQTLMKDFEQTKAQMEPASEFHQMEGVLDKILDIQYPDRFRERMASAQKNKPREGLAVAPNMQASAIAPLLSTPAGQDTAVSQAFHELPAAHREMEGVPPSIIAVIHETQTLVSGATVKIRIEQDIYIQGQRIPKGTFIYGACSLSGERMLIACKTIRFGQQLFPVSLTAYALDGMPGIRIPGSISRDAAKKGTDQAIQAIGLSTLDPSLAAQATSAGIDAAKSLLSKKVKLVRVTLKSDYPLLLHDDNARQ